MAKFDNRQSSIYKNNKQSSSFQGRVIVYSTPGCPHCKKAKELLNSKKVPFVEVDVQAKPEQREYMTKLTQKTSVPQIFFNSYHVGGNSELQMLEQNGSLDEFIQTVKTTPMDDETPEVPTDCLWKGVIVVFSIRSCQSCAKVIDIFAERGTPVNVVEIDDYPDLQEQMIELSGQTSVPQIFFNDKYVGGYKDLLKIGDEEYENLIDYVKSQAPTGAAAELLKQGQFPNVSATNQYDVDISCERDNLSNIVRNMKNVHDGVEIKTRFHHLHSYKKCFIAKELIDWIVARPTLTKCSTRKQALELGQQLVDARLINHVVHDKTFQDKHLFFRFASDCVNVLNAQDCPCLPVEPNDLGKQLRGTISELFDQYAGANGIDESIVADPNYKKFIKMALMLQRVDMLQLDQSGQLAFYLNVYNTLVIHGKIVEGAPKSAFQRSRFFDGVRYIIGGYEYSLNDIEHGIIRSNTKPPGPLSTKRFSKMDPRLKYIQTGLDPRIHFALNCGAKSCPPIKTYSGESVDKQLTLATRSFLEDELQIKGSTITLSMLFKWYGPDFGNSDSAKLNWILDYIYGEKQAQLKNLLLSGKYKITYSTYDWTF